MMLEALWAWELEKRRAAEAARKESLMTQDQFMGMLRQVLQGLGAMLTTLGFTGAAMQIETKTAVIMMIAGPLFH